LVVAERWDRTCDRAGAGSCCLKACAQKPSDFEEVGMGASGWMYIEPSQSSIAETFAALQARVLASGEFLWGDEYTLNNPDLRARFLEHGGSLDDLEPRPDSLHRLAELKQQDPFWEEGTHSILDMDRIISPDEEDHDGTVRPLTEDEIVTYLGSDRPTAAEFEQAYAESALSELTPRRWSGRCTPLFFDDVPAEVAFWGFSGD
jgi:hypothetical protein